MKIWLLFLMLIVFMPFGSALIEVTSQLENEYNLGNELDFSLKIVPDTTTTALIKLTLKCTEKEVLYYVSPIELEGGKEVIIDAPSIKAFSEGSCDIRVNIESFQGENIEGLTSDGFIISDRLDLSFTIDRTDVLPGNKIKIEGSATRKEKEIEDGSIVIRLDSEEEQIDLDGIDFSYELELAEDIKSGEHTIVVLVNDSYGNFNEESKIINVEAIPTKLEFNFNKKEFDPRETLELKVDLLDQAGDLIEGEVELKLLREGTLFKDEIIIFDRQIKANEEFYFTFNYSTLPFEYLLKGSFEDLEEEEVISVLPYQKIEMDIEGYIVHIKNMGNVEYKNETIIVLEKNGEEYLIKKKIRLDVGEETTLDLSKEVPSGSYTVTLPEDSVAEDVMVGEKEEKVIGDALNSDEGMEIKSERKKTSNVIENVVIEDNMPAYKKGLLFITGRAVSGKGILRSRPRIGMFIIIIIILIIIVYLSRGNIKKIIEKIRERRVERF